MFYIYWKRFPFIRILPAFIVGICLGNQITNIDLPILLVTSALVLGCTFLLKSKPIKQSYLFHLILFLIGFSAINSTQDGTNNIKAEKVNAIATILSTLEEKNKTHKTTASLQYKNEANQTIQTTSILYIKKTDAAKALEIGQQILIESQLNEINKPEFPGQFDYNKFMASKGIFYTTYVSQQNWTLIDNQRQISALKLSAENNRNYFSSIIDQNIKVEARGLVKAITLGLKTDLEKETKQSFSKAGIMHILAVSGLHVGIVWSLLSLFFKPIIRFQPKAKNLTILFEIILVWAFAFITGFSPSVQRAAFMFSLFSLSKLNKLEKDSLNILGASAAILLIINAKLLFSVGFQLSYAAVAAIILLYPKIYNLLHFRNRILKYCWQVQCVSFAAVIGTTPITLFYFHQFSIVFPITNLIAIPLAYILVAGTIIMILASKIAIIAWSIGWLVSWTAIGLIQSIAFISNWNYSSLINIYIDSVEVIIVVILISFLTLATYNFRLTKRSIIIALLCINILFAYRGSRKSYEYSKNESIQLNESNYYTSCINVGNKAYTFPNTKSSSNYPTNLSGYFKKALLFRKETISVDFSEFKADISEQQIRYAQSCANF